MSFIEYLYDKNIDAERFQNAEPLLWESWKNEFAQMHPNSFTVHKLYLINPVRRKYTLPHDKRIALKAALHITPIEATVHIPPATNSATLEGEAAIAKTPPAKPAIPRPVFKPKPKMN